VAKKNDELKQLRQQLLDEGKKYSTVVDEKKELETKIETLTAQVIWIGLLIFRIFLTVTSYSSRRRRKKRTPRTPRSRVFLLLSPLNKRH